MPRTKKGEAEKKWRAHVEAWASSGLSVRAFALREGLSVGSLGSWQRRLRPAKTAPRDAATDTSTTSFVPVVLAASTGRRPEAFELVVGESLVLRIPSDFDEVALTRVLRTLGAAR